MAHVEPALAFDNFSGKLSRKERIVMRTRNGKTHAYAIMHPYQGPISENRKPIINAFSEAVAQCKTEMTDPERLAFWQDRYALYSKIAKRNTTKANAQFIGAHTDKYYSTLRGFVIASLSIQLRSAQ